MKFFEEVQMKNIFDKVLITESLCTGPCPLGPIVIVYPEGTWYHKVAQKDVEEIVDQHILQGKPVQRLMIPEDVWG